MIKAEFRIIEDIEETQEYLILILGEVFYQIDKWLSDKK